MRPTFTVLIGSAGRVSLPATLDSIAHQARIPGDQVIVVFDAYERAAAKIESSINLVRSFGDLYGKSHFLAAAHVGVASSRKVIPADYRPDGKDLVVEPGDPYHWLGVEQINHALQNLPITGSHIFTIGDDDIFVDGAYETLRDVCAVNQSRPVLYRFLAPWRDRLWDQPRLAPCRISGCCIAAPRQFVGLHPTDIETTHDYRWIVDIVEAAKAANHPPIWLDYVGVVARPSGVVEHAGVWSCGTCAGWQAHEKNWGWLIVGRPQFCYVCGAAIPDRARIVPEVEG